MLNIGCLATYAGVYIEKGMGLIIPGLTPDTLGEIYEYYPTITEAAGRRRNFRGRIPGVHTDAEGRRADLAWGVYG